MTASASLGEQLNLSGCVYSDRGLRPLCAHKEVLDAQDIHPRSCSIGRSSHDVPFYSLNRLPDADGSQADQISPISP
jgi:hypothetical protein